MMNIRRMELVRAVCGALDGLHGEQSDWSDTAWTKAVKTAICRACREVLPEEGIQLFASGVDGVNGGEWLFDVSCLAYDRAGYISWIPLVAECEWKGQDDATDDFEKLLLARAGVRVMVFDRDYWDSTDHAAESFAAYVRAFQPTRHYDRYLLAAWTPTGFEYRCFLAGDLRPTAPS